MGQKIDARKTALRELIPAGEGHAILSAAKLVKVDHLALAILASERCTRPAHCRGLPVMGLFQGNHLGT
jgi:hypothetical protein